MKPEFQFLGKYVLQDSKRLLVRFEEEKIRFQIDTDTGNPPSNLWAATPPRSDICVYVHPGDFDLASRILARLFDSSMPSETELRSSNPSEGDYA